LYRKANQCCQYANNSASFYEVLSLMLFVVQAEIKLQVEATQSCQATEVEHAF
jgi:hypothetical protein